MATYGRNEKGSAEADGEGAWRSFTLPAIVRDVRFRRSIATWRSEA